MRKFTNVKWGGVALLLVLFVFASGSAWGQVGTLPINQSGGKANLPVGFSQNGLASDYSAEPKLKFDTAGDYLVLQFNGVPQDLSYTFKWNGSGSGSFGSFVVEESADGSVYTELATYTSKNVLVSGSVKKETFQLLSTTRYIRWKYVTKSNGNVGLGEISVTKLDQSNQVVAPEFSRTETTFTEPFILTASCATGGATIHYTLGEDTPTAASLEFPAAGLEISKNTTVNAIAVMADGSLESSEVTSVTYTYELAFAWSATTCTADIMSAENVYPKLTTNSEGAVSYSSSDKSVATIDASTGKITLVGKGKTTITAAIEAWGDFSASTASYELTVINSNEVPVVFFNETFGLPSENTDISAYDGWSETGVVYAGSGKVGENTNNRCTLEGSSGEGYAYATSSNIKDIIIQGINTIGYNNVNLAFNLRKASSKAEFSIYYSVDEGNTYKNITFNASNSTSWNAVSASTVLPSVPNLWLKIDNTAPSYGLYFDDIQLSGVKRPGYTRNVVNGDYGTICLPYAVQASDISGAVFFSVDGKKMTDGKPSSVVMTEVESLEAGKPYIFQATADKIVLAYSGEEATVAGSDNGFIGSFEGQEFDGNPDGNLYLLVQNKIMAIGATAGGRIGKNRAYFDLAQMKEFTGQLSAKQRVFSFNGGVTGIDNITVDADALVDVYAVSGVRVRHAVRMDAATEGLPAGVYVVNGKKVVVK